MTSKTPSTFTCPRCSHIEHDEACDICPACNLDWTDNSDWTDEMMAVNDTPLEWRMEKLA